jgi:hypothetical protein
MCFIKKQNKTNKNITLLTNIMMELFTYKESINNIKKRYDGELQQNKLSNKKTEV